MRRLFSNTWTKTTVSKENRANPLDKETREEKLAMDEYYSKEK